MHLMVVPGDSKCNSCFKKNITLVKTPLPPCIMCVQYIGGCSVHRRVFSTSGDTMSTSGDTMSTSGDITIHVEEQVHKSL